MGELHGETLGPGKEMNVFSPAKHLVLQDWHHPSPILSSLQEAQGSPVGRDCTCPRPQHQELHWGPGQGSSALLLLKAVPFQHSTGKLIKGCHTAQQAPHRSPHLFRKDAVQSLHFLSSSRRLGLVVPISLQRQAEVRGEVQQKGSACFRVHFSLRQELGTQPQGIMGQKCAEHCVVMALTSTHNMVQHT